MGAGIVFGTMGVSDHRAEMPVKKYKNISNCPNQGSLSVAFTNASVLGRCYIVCSQPAASVAVCACAWEKKKIKKKKKKRQKQPTSPPSLWTEMPRRPRLLPKGFYQFCKGLCCRRERCAGRQHESTKPGLTLQYRRLLRTPSPPGDPPSARRQPPAEEKHSPGSTSLPQV